jgi:hypothetical protein
MQGNPGNRKLPKSNLIDTSVDNDYNNSAIFLEALNKSQIIINTMGVGRKLTVGEPIKDAPAFFCILGWT